MGRAIGSRSTSRRSSNAWRNSSPIRPRLSTFGKIHWIIFQSNHQLQRCRHTNAKSKATLFTRQVHLNEKTQSKPPRNQYCLYYTITIRCSLTSPRMRGSKSNRLRISCTPIWTSTSIVPPVALSSSPKCGPFWRNASTRSRAAPPSFTWRVSTSWSRFVPISSHGISNTYNFYKLMIRRRMSNYNPI